MNKSDITVLIINVNSANFSFCYFILMSHSKYIAISLRLSLLNKPYK